MCGNLVTRFMRSIGFQNWPRKMYTATARKKTALIVVDVQNDFISGSLSLSNCPSQHDGSEVVSGINKLVNLSQWDLVVYSKDWHPPEHISFVSNSHRYKPHKDNKVDLTAPALFEQAIYDVDGDAIEQEMWPAHCIQNSEGAEFHKDLIIAEKSVIVHKGTNTTVDSYSAFFDNKRLSETTLPSVLKEREIETVYICGLATDVCVKFTCLDARSLGYETFLIEDCCRGVSCDQIKDALEKLQEAGVHITSSDDILAKSDQNEK